MNRSIDVRNEVRKLASSKPVHAVAGAGVLASQALRELPARLAKLRHDETLVSLPGRATEYVLTMRAKAVSEYGRLRHEAAVTSLPGRATEYVHTARAKAVSEYERLASRGEKAMTEHAITSGNGALNGKGAKGTSAKGTSARSTGARSTGPKSTRAK